MQINSTQRQALLAKVQALSAVDGLLETAIPGLKIFQRSEDASGSPTVYEPMLCVLLQGEKRIDVGPQSFAFHECECLLIPVMLPVVGRVINASPERPYVGISFDLDMRELAELVIDMADVARPCTADPHSINIICADEPLFSVFDRFIDLLNAPADIPVLLPLLKRELMYRLLKGPLGEQLRQFLLFDTQANRIAKVLDIIRHQFTQPLRIPDLAAQVHMSESALYAGFKAVTSMSPLQYQKQLRLNEARRIMLQDGLEAAAASYRVGYESPSQFSREYSRLFGAPPATDVNRFRQVMQ